MCSMKPKILTVYRLGRHSARRPASWKHPLCEVAETVFLSSPAFPSLSLHKWRAPSVSIQFPLESKEHPGLGATCALLLYPQPRSPAPFIGHHLQSSSQLPPHLYLDPSTVHISFSDAPSYSREAILSHLGSSPSASMVSFQPSFDLP